MNHRRFFQPQYERKEERNLGTHGRHVCVRQAGKCQEAGEGREQKNWKAPGDHPEFETPPQKKKQQREKQKRKNAHARQKQILLVAPPVRQYCVPYFSAIRLTRILRVDFGKALSVYIERK